MRFSFLLAAGLALFGPVLSAGAPLSSSPTWITSGQSASHYGRCVSGVGDVNGDGFDDVAVTAIFFDNGQVDEGGAWLYLGSPAGPDTAADWRAEGNQPNAQMGHAVAGAGDVNDDGFDDLLVGVPGASRAHLYLGSPSGPALVPSWTASTCCSYGFSLASAGDVNNDGYDDVVVGAMNGGTLGEGIVQVFHGSAAGLSPVPNWSAEGNQDFANFGRSVAGAGDVNGDGFDDVVIGAPNYANGEVEEGRVYVYHGSPTGLASTPAWFVDSDQPVTYFGFSVAGAGDVNGDGFDDVIAGATWWSQGVAGDDGRATVYLGSAAGLAQTPVFTTYGVNAELGFSVGSAGDLNRDGFSDVIVGVPHYHVPEYTEGAAFVFLGSPTGPSQSPDWIGELNLDSAHLGQSAAGAGDVNGDTYDDVILGAPYSHCPPDPGFPPCGPIPAFSVLYLGQPTTSAVDQPAAPAAHPLALTLTPNPSAHATHIGYTLVSPAEVSLQIFDLAGRVRATVVAGRNEAGPQRVRFDGRDDVGRPLSSGVYFVRLTAGARTAIEKLVIAR